MKEGRRREGEGGREKEGVREEEVIMRLRRYLSRVVTGSSDAYPCKSPF